MVSIVTRGETYRHLLYLATALPLGMVYLTILVAGLGLGLALTPLVVGVPILVGVFLLVGLASLRVISAVARLSGRVAGAFLDGGA